MFRSVPRQRCRPAVEALEDRLAPVIEPFRIEIGGIFNVVFIDNATSVVDNHLSLRFNAANELEYSVNRGPFMNLEAPFADINGIFVLLGVGSDQLELDLQTLSTGSFVSPFSVNSLETEIELLDRTSLERINVEVAGTELIRFTGKDADDLLSVRPGGTGTLRVDNSATGSGRVRTDVLPTVEFNGLDLFDVSTSSQSETEVTFAIEHLIGAFANTYQTNLQQRDTLIIEGTNSGNTFRLSKPVDGVVAVSNRFGTTVTEMSSAFVNVHVKGLNGDDRLEVLVGGGSDVIASPVIFDGGLGSDRVQILGSDPLTAVDAVLYTPGPGAGQGRLRYENAADARLMLLDLLNTEGVIDAVSATSLTVRGTDAANAISYSSSQNFVGGGRVAVDNLQSVEFDNKTTLVLDAGSGSDEINISGFPTPAALTSITINGGNPGELDTLAITGTAAAETFEYVPTGPVSGAVLVPGPDVTFTGVEAVVIDGQSTFNDDTLTVRSALGFDRVTLTPGASADDGTFQIGSTAGVETMPRLTFRRLGQDAFIELRSGAGAGAREDTFEYLGTSTPNTFDVTTANGGTIALNAGSLALNLRKPVRAPGASALVLEGLDGDDTFRVAGDHPFTEGVQVNGGNPSAGDALTVHGGGAALAVDLSTATVTETGFGPISYAGVESATLNAAAADVTIVGTAGDDVVAVTPTGTGAGTFQATGGGAVASSSPAFTYAGLGAAAFTVAGGAGFDILAVLGTDGFDAVTAFAANAVTVTRASAGTVTAGADLERLDVRAFAGNDSINLAAFTALPTRIDTGAGNDTVTGSPQADAIDGGEGDDLLSGGTGDDVLDGGAGDDVLDGDGGSDRLQGGVGSDTHLWDPGDGSDLVEGGDGADVLAFNGSSAGEVFTFNAAGTHLELLRDVGAVDLDVAGVEQVDVNRDFTFTASLDQAQEVPAPPAANPAATGTATLRYNAVNNTFDLDLFVRGLTGAITVSHLHPGAAGAANPPIVDLGGQAAYFADGDGSAA